MIPSLSVLPSYLHNPALFVLNCCIVLHWHVVHMDTGCIYMATHASGVQKGWSLGQTALYSPTESMFSPFLTLVCHIFKDLWQFSIHYVAIQTIIKPGTGQTGQNSPDAPLCLEAICPSCSKHLRNTLFKMFLNIPFNLPHFSLY